MAQVSIPVDLFNPGQVFACMGFLEVADVLLGKAAGGFSWDGEPHARFELRAGGTDSPVERVLTFLIEAEIQRLAPNGYADPLPATRSGAKKRKETKQAPREGANESTDDGPLYLVEEFPAPEADRLSLPLRLKRNDRVVRVSHWCDASSRNSFKLFAGQQRSAAIARQMLGGVRRLWNECREALISDPLGLTLPLGGSSFKFDARKAWTTIDAGYSPDDQNHDVEASPVVEILAPIGLEHARPHEFEPREVRYGVWKGLLPPMLARPALGGVRVGVPLRLFRFTLALAGKNKNVTFAEEETSL